MTRQHVKDLLPILIAFSEGKKIETNQGYQKWKELTDPNFEAIPSSYRIKKEPTLVQFSFEDSNIFKDKWIKQKKSIFENLYRIVRFDSDSISIIGESGIVFYVNYYAMLTLYVFEDGSVCGKPKI